MNAGGKSVILHGVKLPQAKVEKLWYQAKKVDHL